ncbi:unnamed protein product [Gadus morhua 'NCC']
MSRRSRPPAAPGLHPHCESCYSRRCRARPEGPGSCALAPCPLLCGAVFHLCKQEEHALLCPRQRRPCLNAAYGCPHAMPRAARAAHLASCPASVVSCSMEWNRWPADDAHSHPLRELHANLLREQGGGGPSRDLDLAMALRDQDHLFHSLKMKSLFPELCAGREDEGRRGGEEEEEEREEPNVAEKGRREAERGAVRADGAEGGATSDHMSRINVRVPGDEAGPRAEEEEEEEEEEEPSQEEREALARRSGVDPELLQSYAAWERMFSMEKGGCSVAGGGAGPAAARLNRGSEKGSGLGALPEEEPGTAPAARGALAGGFVYGYVEPMKIISVRTFHVPTSFIARQGRIRNPGFYKRESRSVDTSDLAAGLENTPVWEEVQASLLCSLEKEHRGHLIAESTSFDTLLQDEGTQTYHFLSAPFRSTAVLADLTEGRPAELHVQLQMESVTSRHNKASSAFSFLCGHSFPRREYTHHFRNVHADVQTCLSGWFEQRCPLSYLGCTFSQRRFQPSTHKATVTYNQDLSCFSLRPLLPEVPPGPGGRDSLSRLPYEVLCHVASFLDSLSLSQLALVSRLLRDVCSSLLSDRGMVTLRWQRRTGSQGRAEWSVGEKVWEFSTLFSPVSQWCFQDVPHMSEHMKVCHFYQTELRTQGVPLPCLGQDVRTRAQHSKPSLVTTFPKKIIMEHLMN